MAYFLKKSASSSEYVSFPTYSIAAGADFVIEYTMANTAALAALARVLGRLANTTSDLTQRADSMQLEQSGGPNYTMTFGSMSTLDRLNNGNPWRITITRSSNLVSAVALDLETGLSHTSEVVTITGSFEFNQLFRHGTFGTGVEMDLYGIKFDGARNYDPSASNGTGSTLIDTVGGNNGTLVNFPTDDSQWVFYESGGPSVQDIQPALKDTDEEVYTHTVTVEAGGQQTITPSFVLTDEQFYTGQIGTAGVGIDAPYILTEEVVYSHNVLASGIFIQQQDSIPTDEVVYDSTLTTGPYGITEPEFVFSQEDIYTMALVIGSMLGIEVEQIATNEELYGSTVATGEVAIQLQQLIASAEFFYTGRLQDPNAVVLLGTLNDKLYSALSDHSGTINDRMFKYLRAKGLHGTLNDMIVANGGWSALLIELGVV
jgi:hypothetical protein